MLTLSTALLTRAAQHPITVSGTCANARTRREYLDQALIAARPEYTDRKSLLDDAMRTVENYLKERTMTTTPAATAAPRSAAHQEVIDLRAEVQALHADLIAAHDSIAYLRDQSIQQHAELKETLTHIAEGRGFDRIRTDELHHAIDRIIGLLEAKPAQAAAIAPQTAPPTTTTAADNSGTIEILQGVTIKKGVNEKTGAITVKITTTDPRWSQYGVTVWPEAMQDLGINANALAFGSTPFERKIKVAVNNGKSKAIALA